MCQPSDLKSAGDPSSPPCGVDSMVPQTDISQSVYRHAASLLHPSILRHSIRVYLYARALARHNLSAYYSEPAKRDLLFAACLFHDIGTTSQYDGSQRFEVEGGDAAVKHLSRFGISETDQHDVWTAIAVHTSPGIAERIGELSKLVRIAVVTDLGRRTAEWETLAPLRDQLEQEYARSEIEKVLGDAVVEQAKRQPEKAPMVSWPGVMYRAWLAEPEWDGVNKAF